MACSVWDPNCPEERMTQSVFNASANVGNVIIGYYSPGNGTTRF
jgi:hypothetical protein